MHIYDFNRNALIDEKITNAFTEEHLEAHKRLCPMESYPEYTNELPFDSIEFLDTDIVSREHITNDSEIDPRTQKARAGGSIDESDMKLLSSSFHTKGVKLNNLAPMVFKYGENKYKYITGHSRDFVYDTYNFSNAIVNIFQAKEGSTDTELRNDLSAMGLFTNPKVDPQVETSMEDMILELTTAIQQNWIDGKNFNQVRKRARLFGERINLSSTKIDQCASTAINQCETNPFDKVYPMLSSDAEKWLVDHNFIDVKDKIKYFSKSYDFSSKATVDCIKYAHANPKEEVRIIVHCGVVWTDEQWEDRVKKFYNEYHAILNAFQNVIFNGCKQKPQNIKLYGAIPQVGSISDHNKLCFYKTDGTGETYQK